MDSDYKKMKQTFTENLTNIIKAKCINHGFLTREKYLQLIDHISELKLKSTGKSPGDYQKLKRYNVIKEGDCNRLICPVKGTNKIVKYYICNEDIFDTIHNIHIAIGHGGRNRIISELNKQYKNITAESIMLYLSLCRHCQRKSKGCRKASGVVKPAEFDEMTSRGIVDLIDMQTQVAKEYNFILVYQDQHTKFLQLRPLRSNRIEEVANVLLDILTIFGAPSILQSNNDREFTKRLIKELSTKWKELRMVHGKPVNSTSTGSIMDQNIKNMLIDWLEANPSRSWVDGLRFVQSMKNRAYHPDVKCSPYEALFGTPMKIGLNTSWLPNHMIGDIKEEEELDIIMEQYRNNDQIINEDEESITEDSTGDIKIEKHDVIEDAEESYYNDEIDLPGDSITGSRNKETLRKRKYLEDTKIQAKKMKEAFR